MIAGRGIPCRVRGKLRVPRAFISYTLGQLRSIDRFRTVETVETAEAVETVQTVQTVAGRTRRSVVFENQPENRPFQRENLKECLQPLEMW